MRHLAMPIVLMLALGACKKNEVSVPTEQKIYFVTASALNLRSTPSRSGQALSVFEKGDPVSVVDQTTNKETIDGRNGTWVKVRPLWRSAEGFLFDAYLEEAPIVKNIEYLSTWKSLTADCNGDKYRECIADVNKKLNSSYPKVFAPMTRDVVILLRNGKTKEFKRKDGPNVGDSVQIPMVGAVYEDAGYVHVMVAFYEGGGHYLVSLEDGTTIQAIAAPILSPDKKRFLAACNGVAYVTPGLEVINIESGKPQIEYTTIKNREATFTWQYDADWRDSTTIRVNRYAMAGMGGLAKQERTLMLLEGKWVLQ